jgi:hypothetical protein
MVRLEGLEILLVVVVGFTGSLLTQMANSASVFTLISSSK